MYCKKCGKEIEEDSTFCKFCGASVLGDNVHSKRKNYTSFIVAATVVLIAIIFAGTYFGIPAIRYNKCETMVAEGSYDQAVDYIVSVNDKRCNTLLPKCYYNIAVSYVNDSEWDNAIETLKKTEYNDSADLLSKCYYESGKQLMENSEWNAALEKLSCSSQPEASLSIEICQKHINSDFAFQEEFEKTYYDNSKDLNTLCNALSAVVSKYADATFYDTELKKKTIEFGKSLETCYNSKNKEIKSASLDTAEAVIEYCESCKEIYYFLIDTINSYGFFADDDSLLAEFEKESEEYNQYYEIHKDAFDQLENEWKKYSPTSSGMYLSWENNTDYNYEINVTVTFQYYVGDVLKTVKREKIIDTDTEDDSRWKNSIHDGIVGGCSNLAVESATWSIESIEHV